MNTNIKLEMQEVLYDWLDEMSESGKYIERCCYKLGGDWEDDTYGTFFNLAYHYSDRKLPGGYQKLANKMYRSEDACLDDMVAVKLYNRCLKNEPVKKIDIEEEGDDIWGIRFQIIQMLIEMWGFEFPWPDGCDDTEPEDNPLYQFYCSFPAFKHMLEGSTILQSHIGIGVENTPYWKGRVR